jgi:excisionase family DNA binding protein
MTGTPALPDPETEPTVDLWPTAGQALGIGRNTAYEAARRGEIPTVRCGRRLRVPTAALRRLLGLIDDAA